MQKLLVIYTGGTIGMEKSADGKYRPTSGFADLVATYIAPKTLAKMPEHDYLEISPAIDSADITPQHCQQIASTITERYDHYSGFLVLHGTDTMAYTAAMLSFMLGGLNKMVILTGAQVPLSEAASDAAHNFLVALKLLTGRIIPEVCIYFANQLLRGNRASKMSTSAMGAFASPNYPALGVFATQPTYYLEYCLASVKPDFQSNMPQQPLTSGLVNVVYLTPGMPESVISDATSDGVSGLVIVSYGAGNIPIGNQNFIKSLHQANEQGITIINVSQCISGHVHEQYAASIPLQTAGVISAEDMTIEAAVTKLYYLLCRYHDDRQKIREQLQRSLRGEMSFLYN